jgi:putative SOS response-associated peptidase YedK
MCGRYRLSRRKQIIAEHFETADWQDDWNPRYNIAPTQPILWASWSRGGGAGYFDGVIPTTFKHFTGMSA